MRGFVDIIVHVAARADCRLLAVRVPMIQHLDGSYPRYRQSSRCHSAAVSLKTQRPALPALQHRRIITRALGAAQQLPASPPALSRKVEVFARLL